MEKSNSKKYMRVLKYSSVAACLALLVFAGTTTWANDLYRSVKDKVVSSDAYTLFVEHNDENSFESKFTKKYLYGKIFDEKGNLIDAETLTNGTVDGKTYDKDGNQILGMRVYNKKGKELFPSNNPLELLAIDHVKFIIEQTELEEYNKLSGQDDYEEIEMLKLTYDGMKERDMGFDIKALNMEGMTFTNAEVYADSKDYADLYYEDANGNEISLLERARKEETAFETEISKDSVEFDVDGASVVFDRTKRELYLTFENTTVDVMAKNISDDAFMQIANSLVSIKD